MLGYLERDNANLGGAFRASRASDDVIDAGRAAIADFVGGLPEEIAFGANMTTLNFLLAHAVTRTFEPGDEIVTTWLDHDANVSPWLLVAKDRGLVVHQVDVVEPELDLDYDQLERLINERTRVVAFTLASNAVGTMPDAGRVAQLAHQVGALAWADAVHYAPHRRIDVTALGVDVLLCSPYKFFGPHLGCAWARKELLESWPADRVRPADELPAGHRFETGTQSHEAIAAATAAVDYLASLGEGSDRRARLDDAYDRIRAHEEDLSAHALRRLSAIPGLTVYGIADPGAVAKRTATFCVTLEGHAPRALAEALGAESIASWDGNYYALSIMQRLGLEEQGGGLRIGFLHYTTLDEVDRALDVLERLAAS
jgi:cysteine desulfurase family protein (TIGR01976 family)